MKSFTKKGMCGLLTVAAVTAGLFGSAKPAQADKKQTRIIGGAIAGALLFPEARLLGALGGAGVGYEYNKHREKQDVRRYGYYNDNPSYRYREPQPNYGPYARNNAYDSGAYCRPMERYPNAYPAYPRYEDRVRRDETVTFDYRYAESAPHVNCAPTYPSYSSYTSGYTTYTAPAPQSNCVPTTGYPASYGSSAYPAYQQPQTSGYMDQHGQFHATASAPRITPGYMDQYGQFHATGSPR